jgi:hypothetical protein
MHADAVLVVLQEGPPCVSQTVPKQGLAVPQLEKQAGYGGLQPVDVPA